MRGIEDNFIGCSMKRMYPIVLDIKENRSNDPDVIARNLRISVHYRSLPKHLKGLLIKTPFQKGYC